MASQRTERLDTASRNKPRICKKHPLSSTLKQDVGLMLRKRTKLTHIKSSAVQTQPERLNNALLCPTRVPLKESADSVLYSSFLSESESAALYQQMDFCDSWRVKKILVYGRWYEEPRQTACFSHPPGVVYKYNAVSNAGSEMPSLLLEAKTKIERALEPTHGKLNFNFVLANRYRSGADKIGDHSDDEKSLVGPIASLSLGATRVFHFKPKDNSLSQTPKKVDVPLTDGSLLVMSAATQRLYKHGIAATKEACGVRINLTFRCVSSP